MTLNCKTKTKNVNLFLSKDQLLSETATGSYTGEICNVLKCGPNPWNSSTSLRFCLKNEPLHWYYLKTLRSQIQNVSVCTQAFSNFGCLVVFHLGDIFIKIVMITNFKVIDPILKYLFWKRFHNNHNSRSFQE